MTDSSRWDTGRAIDELDSEDDVKNLEKAYKDAKKGTGKSDLPKSSGSGGAPKKPGSAPGGDSDLGIPGTGGGDPSTRPGTTPDEPEDEASLGWAVVEDKASSIIPNRLSVTYEQIRSWSDEPLRDSDRTGSYRGDDPEGLFGKMASVVAHLPSYGAPGGSGSSSSADKGPKMTRRGFGGALAAAAGLTAAGASTLNGSEEGSDENGGSGGGATNATTAQPEYTDAQTPVETRDTVEAGDGSKTDTPVQTADSTRTPAQTPDERIVRPVPGYDFEGIKVDWETLEDVDQVAVSDIENEQEYVNLTQMEGEVEWYVIEDGGVVGYNPEPEGGGDAAYFPADEFTENANDPRDFDELYQDLAEDGRRDKV